MTRSFYGALNSTFNRSLQSTACGARPTRRWSATNGDEVSFAEPERESPRQIETVRESSSSRKVERHPQTVEVSLTIVDDFSQFRDMDHGLAEGGIAREWWAIDPADPLSARGETHRTSTLSRNEWSLRTETFSTMRSYAKNFYPISIV